MTAEDKTNNTKTLREWLFPFKSPDFTKAGWLGAGFGVAVIVLGAGLGVSIATAAITAAIYFLIEIVQIFRSDEPDGSYLRGLTYLIAFVFGAPFLIWRTVIASNQARAAEQGHITERYIQAVELLGGEKTQKTEDKETTVPNIEVRIGALYTLERIAKESQDDHISIMETICAYIRNNAGLYNKGYDRVDTNATNAAREEAIEEGKLSDDEIREIFVYLKPREDIQTALTILGRRGEDRLAYEADAAKNSIGRAYELDLRETMLAKADLNCAVLGPVRLDGANLTEAWLYGANLTEAMLYRANLRETGLEGANLTGARLNRANLTRARLDRANMTEARLIEAKLTKACLIGANLTRAWMMGANLTEARLWKANLTGVELESTNLSRWTFARTRLRLVDFTKSKNLTQEDVNSGFGVKSGFGLTLLPEGLDYPSHWHDAKDSEKDSQELRGAYQSAYVDWLKTRPPN